MEYYLDSEGEEETDDHENTEGTGEEEPDQIDSDQVSQRKRRISDRHHVREHEEFFDFYG